MLVVVPYAFAQGGIPTDLIGVWQQTLASSGDYRNTTTGQTFSMTAGFTAQLKLRGDGSYYLAHYSSGVAPGCALVAYYDQSIGAAAWQGAQLILQPTDRVLQVTNCSDGGTRTLANDPIVFDARLTEEFDLNGLRSLRLDLTGALTPLSLTVLHRKPLATGYQPTQSPDFVLGDAPPYDEFIGLWAPDSGSDTRFYDPASGAFYLPDPNGSEHEYLRLFGGEYELARAWRDYSFDGVCKKDYVYYERGQPAFSISQNAQGQDERFWGHVRFTASDARLIVNLYDCEEDDAVLRYSLAPQTSYYRWVYSRATADFVAFPESFSLICDWERSEWQFMVCDGSSASTTYRRQE